MLARAYAGLALCISHEDLREAAKTMLRAQRTDTGDSMTFSLARDLDLCMDEITRFSKYLRSAHPESGPLTAMPYPFPGYEDLPGNLVPDGAVGQRIWSITASGSGGSVISGGGASGTIMRLAS